MKQTPNLIVGGAPKSGTTALYHYFEQHPSICLSQKKELHYFSRPWLESDAGGPGDKYVLAEVPETFEDYVAFFDHCADAPVIADISPSYLYHSESAREMKERLGDIKALFILRNPADKAFSLYMHLLGAGRETLGFAEALAAEEDRSSQGYSDMWMYRKSGFYADDVERFMHAFGKENVLVLYYEEFVGDQAAALREICRFVGVDEAFDFTRVEDINKSGKPRSSIVAKLIAPNLFTYFLRRMIPQRLGRYLRTLIKKANTGDKPGLPDDLRQRLMNDYRDDIRRLESLLGKPSGWLKE